MATPKRSSVADLLGQIPTDDEALTTEKTPLGMPPGTPATRLGPGYRPGDDPRARHVGGWNPGGRAPEPVELYTSGAEWAPGAWDQNSQWRLQQQLIDAGLLNRKNIVAGFWDSTSASAYKQLLMYANQRGSSAERVLPEFAQMAGASAQQEVNPINPYEVEDMALKVKEYLRKKYLVPISDEAAMQWAQQIVQGQQQQPTVG